MNNNSILPTFGKTSTWNKPARDRHAHVSLALAEKLEEAPKAAYALCHYLFRACIDGKLEEIGIYDLPLGENRSTEKRKGKRYARNTMREALKFLVKLGLVIIEKAYRSGVFKLTVCHPGAKIPFVRKPTVWSENGPFNQKTDKREPETRINSYPITEKFREIAEQAAAKKNEYTRGEEKREATRNVSLPTSRSEVLQDEGDRQELVVNTEAEEILSVVRDVMLLNPQIQAEVLKYTLTDVQAAIALYQERKTKKSISNPHGFLTDALRGKWAASASSVPAATFDLFPAELVKWYEWAITAGIVDGRPLRHCPNASTHSSNERLQVVIPIPPEERRPNDITPFKYIPWREAIALYPMESSTDRQDLALSALVVPEESEAVELPEDYFPNSEIQNLIKQSMGFS